VKNFYFFQEVAGPVLETWEVEVLITLAVVLGEYDTKQLAQLQVPNVYTRAVRISTLYTRSATTVNLLLASCGYPVAMAEVIVRSHCH
jgi:hypothetical protein